MVAILNIELGAVCNHARKCIFVFDVFEDWQVRFRIVEKTGLSAAFCILID